MNLEEKLNLLKTNPHVWAVGDGFRTIGGKKTGSKCSVVHVEKKLAKAEIASQYVLPHSVDVLQSGVIRALGNTGRYRPAPGGVSVGHPAITAGTLGCWVQKDGEWHILSNNHVLANSNNAEIGDPILQPGPIDGGSDPNDRIAYLSDFVKLHFMGEDSDCPLSKAVAQSLSALWKYAAKITGQRPKTRFSAIVPQADTNLVDAAIAKVIDPAVVNTDILNIGKIVGWLPGELGMPVKKSGRTTGFTDGVIEQINAVVQVSYGFGKVAYFTDQLMAGAMSQGGDSGSAVVSDNNKLVGLLFAGSDTTTVICRVEHVMDAFKINL